MIMLRNDNDNEMTMIMLMLISLQFVKQLERTCPRLLEQSEEIPGSDQSSCKPGVFGYFPVWVVFCMFSHLLLYIQSTKMRNIHIDTMSVILYVSGILRTDFQLFTFQCWLWRFLLPERYPQSGLHQVKMLKIFLLKKSF